MLYRAKNNIPCNGCGARIDVATHIEKGDMQYGTCLVCGLQSWIDISHRIDIGVSKELEDFIIDLVSNG
jgi:hypothetical protein